MLIFWTSLKLRRKHTQHKEYLDSSFYCREFSGKKYKRVSNPFDSNTVLLGCEFYRSAQSRLRPKNIPSKSSCSIYSFWVFLVTFQVEWFLFRVLIQSEIGIALSSKSNGLLMAVLILNLSLKLLSFLCRIFYQDLLDVHFSHQYSQSESLPNQQKPDRTWTMSWLLEILARAEVFWPRGL